MPVLGNILFSIYQLNEAVNKFLLAGDKFISVMHSWQPGFTFNACGIFPKNIGQTQQVKESGDSRYIYQKRIRQSFLLR